MLADYTSWCSYMVITELKSFSWMGAVKQHAHHYELTIASRTVLFSLGISRPPLDTIHSQFDPSTILITYSPKIKLCTKFRRHSASFKRSSLKTECPCTAHYPTPDDLCKSLGFTMCSALCRPVLVPLIFLPILSSDTNKLRSIVFEIKQQTQKMIAEMRFCAANLNLPILSKYMDIQQCPKWTSTSTIRKKVKVPRD